MYIFLQQFCKQSRVHSSLQLARVEDPDIVVIMPSSSKGGIMEKYIKVFSVHSNSKVKIFEVHQGFQKANIFLEIIGLQLQI